MITLAEAEQRIHGMLCPRCLHAQLSAWLHLSREHEYICTARCSNCRHEFPLEGAYLKTLAEAQTHIAQSLTTMVCPGCATPEFAFEFRCDLGDRYCHFLALCRSCGQVFRVLDRHKRVVLTRI